MLKKGLFITLEGPDGSGKTTQAQKLYEYLSRRGYSVVRTREPGGTKVAEQIRAILLDPGNKITPSAEIFLYEAVRAQHVQELIKPSLEKGAIVICERFSDATFAYQGYGRKIEMKLIKSLDKFATDNIVPDLTILLDVPPKIGLSRVINDHKNRPPGQADRMEQEDLKFHTRVRKGYLELARREPRRVRVLLAQQPADEIHEQIIKYVEQVITKKRRKNG